MNPWEILNSWTRKHLKDHQHKSLAFWDLPGNAASLPETLFSFINPALLVKDDKAHRIWLSDQKYVRADKRLGKKKNHRCHPS